MGNRLSVGLALDDLGNVCEEIANLKIEYEAKLQELYEERNDLIVDAVRNKVPITKVQEITKLSRERIFQVRQGWAPK